MGAKINLSEETVFTIKGKDIKVFQASMSTLEEAQPMLEELQKVESTANTKEQIALLIKLIYHFIKDDNDVTPEDLKKILTIGAATTILQAAIGNKQA